MDACGLGKVGWLFVLLFALMQDVVALSVLLQLRLRSVVVGLGAFSGHGGRAAGPSWVWTVDCGLWTAGETQDVARPYLDVTYPYCTAVLCNCLSVCL